ncbi:MAG: DUF2339 domain-containing protein [Patescibacteria group bacterium]
MADNTEKIEKKLEEIEARLTRLEDSGTVEKSIPQTKKEVVQEEGKSTPIGSVIALIIGGLILWNSLPRFLSGYFFGNSYGYSSYSSASLIFVFFGACLAALGIRGIIVSRGERAGEHGSKNRFVPTAMEGTSSLEVGGAGHRTEKAEEKKNSEDSIEFQIASHWFSIVGIIAILLGVVFFLKYAFDNHLIGPTGQVSIGIIFGIGLLLAGDFFRAKYAQYSQIITGGGIGVLYLSLWAAFAVFSLVDTTTVLFAMSLVTVASALLAIRYDAIYIAALGVLGGFATPGLLAKGIENEMLLMSYILILNLGVLFVAFFKNWKSLNLLTFGGTYFIFSIWYGNFYDPGKLLITFIFLTLLFIIFSFVWVVYQLIYEKKIEEVDILLIIFNAAVYFGLTYLLINRGYKDYLGFFAFALSFYYFVFGYIAYTKFKAESALTLGLLGTSIIFLTVAVPLQVKSNLITLIWAVEGAVILWLGFWLSSYKLRVGALAIYILVGVRLVFFDSVIPSSEFILLANRRFLTYVAAAASAAVASWLYVLYKGKTDEDEKAVLPALLIGLNVVLVVAMTLESTSFFGAKITSLNERLYKTQTPGSVGTQIPQNNVNTYSYNLNQRIPYQNNYTVPVLDTKVLAEIKATKGARDFSISAIWLFYSLTLLIVGVLAKYKPIRLSALVFFAVTILKVFLVDSSNLAQLYRIIAFIGLGTILLVVAYIYQRYKAQINAFLLNG